VTCLGVIARAAQADNELAKRINWSSARELDRQGLSKRFNIRLSFVVKERPICNLTALIETKQRTTATAAASANDGDEKRDVESAHNA